MTNYDAPPTVLPETAREAHCASGVPVLVTDSGINTADDAQRVRHLRASVTNLLTVDDVPLLGYFQWTLMDDYSFAPGYRPRFGLSAVDRPSFRRTPKPSLGAYRTLIAEMRRLHPTRA